LIDRVAHGGEIAHGGDAGEVLHQDARRAELDLVRGVRGRVPGGDRADVVGGDRGAVLPAQEVLEQDAHRVGQGGDVADAGLGERVEAVDLDLAVADEDMGLAAEAVRRHGGGTLPPLMQRHRRRYGVAWREKRCGSW
jgi:hypothetical protein